MTSRDGFDALKAAINRTEGVCNSQYWLYRQPRRTENREFVGITTLPNIFVDVLESVSRVIRAARAQVSTSPGSATPVNVELARQVLSYDTKTCRILLHDPEAGVFETPARTGPDTSDYSGAPF